MRLRNSKDSPYPSYPTEKNLEMLKVIAEASSRPNDIVLDCFAGSGTTGVLAEELGLSSIQIDIKKEYCIMTCNRLSKEITQRKLTKDRPFIEKRLDFKSLS